MEVKVKCKVGEHLRAIECKECPDKDNCPADQPKFDRVKAERNSFQEPFVGCSDEE
jgi:hypothetical protein